MSSTAIRVFLLTISLVGTGCSGSSLEQEESESVQERTQCGPTNDNFDVELYDGSVSGFSIDYVARYQGAFGRHCSGTLIAPNLFLTANHEDCPVLVGESVGFNCQVSASDPNPPNPDAAASANCEWFTSVAVSNYPAIDASVTTLSGDPGYKYGFVFPTATPLSVGDPIALFHHPLSGRRKVVGFGTVDSLSGNALAHSIDTRGGSSGGGILNQAGLLVGIHLRAGCTATGGHNGGNVMTAIIDQVPEVRGIVAAGWLLSAF